MYTEEQRQIFLPSASRLFTPGVIALIILSIAGLLLSALVGDSVINVLALNPQSFIHGRIWQIITYPFISNSAINLIFSGLIILLVGSKIENQWRTASFLLLWLVVSIGCGLLWIIINLLTGNNLIGTGAAGCSYGLMATLALLFRGQKFFFFFATVSATQMVIILAVIAVLMNLAMPINLVWVSGALIAYLYTKLRWRMASTAGRNIDETAQRRSSGFVDID